MLRRRAVQQRGCLVSSFYCSGRTLIICCVFGFNNSKDMLLYLFILLCHCIAMASMNSIEPENTEEHVAEGGNIKLTCKYEGAIYNIQWYRQYQTSRPEFLLSITEDGSIHPSDSDFSAHINKTEKRVDLQISSAAVSDSAVYYCALNDAARKLIFGKGTKLFIQPREEYLPSYYKLTKNSSAVACLAAGFSRHDATKTNKLFKGTEAVRISDDSLYNQVVLIRHDEEQCKTTAGVCGLDLEPDEKVNLMSLTILGLRLIFLKTVIFNVLMTLRLWISQ